MTLIAGLSFENVPMLIGDLLISSDHPSEQHVELPSVGDSQNVIEPGFHISLALCQKIFQVNRFTAVAWSGSYIAARGFLSEFKNFTGDRRLSPVCRSDFFDALLSDKDFADLSLIGITAISGKETDFFGYNVHSRPNERFGQCIYAGSGSDAFPSTADMSPPMLLEGPPAERAISTAYGLIGTFLTREINSRSLATDIEPNPLLERYGGGWELAGVGDGTVHKLGNVTSFFWHISEHDNGKFELKAPSIILKTHYEGAFLVRRWLRGNGSLRWFAPWSEQRCAVTKPIVGDGSQIDVSDPISWPSLASKFEVHAVLITPNKGKQFVLNWTCWLHPQNASENSRFTESVADRCTVVEVQSRAVQMIHSFMPSILARMKQAGQP